MALSGLRIDEKKKKLINVLEQKQPSKGALLNISSFNT